MTKKKKDLQKQMLQARPSKSVTRPPLLEEAAERHRLAEEKAAHVPEDPAALASTKSQQTLQELCVHQIELEVQNEELRTTQVELEAARIHYFDLYNQAPVGYVTVSVSGLILEANVTATTLMDTIRSAMVKRSLIRFICKEDQDIYCRHFKQLLATATPQVFELRIVKKAGPPCWVRMDATVAQDAGGAPLYRVTLSDISERKRAEEALMASEVTYRSLVETTNTGYLILDGEGRVVDANQEYVRLTGHRELREILGRRVLEWTAEYEKPKNAEAVAQCVKTGHIRNLVIDYVDEKGRITPVEINATGQVEGGSLRIISLCRDITERKWHEAELLKMQKIQSVGTLAGGIAHDFNNILLGLFGNISLAKDDLSKEHPSYALLEEAEQSMNRAIRLTKQLLTFAKGGDPVKEDLRLGALVEEVARFDLSGSNVNLVYHQAEDLWQAKADKGQIQQVVSNLVINARQAMPKGGCLRITLENADLPEAAIPGLHQGHYAKITVRDEGTGIDPINIDQIFDPYFTTKQTGNGLGLATAYAIIHKHGGHISIVSELGKGTTFTLYLPAAVSPQRAEAKQPAVEGPLADRHARILMMDDEEVVCGIVIKMLSRCGFSVATAPGGQEAMALYRQAREAGAPFDAVIMDLTIPGGMGGEEAIKNLLALDPHAKVIVSSGYADDPVMANYADFGFKGIATKPYTISELRAVLARVLQR